MMRMVLRNVMENKEFELAAGSQVSIEGHIAINIQDKDVKIRYCWPSDIKEIKYIDTEHKDQKIEVP